MPKYRVYLQTVASTSVEVEAEDKQEAVELALEKDMPHICAQCSGWGQDYSLEVGDEWDIGANMKIDEAVEEIED